MLIIFWMSKLLFFNVRYLSIINKKFVFGSLQNDVLNRRCSKDIKTPGKFAHIHSLRSSILFLCSQKGEYVYLCRAVFYIVWLVRRKRSYTSQHWAQCQAHNYKNIWFACAIRTRCELCCSHWVLSTPRLCDVSFLFNATEKLLMELLMSLLHIATYAHDCPYIKATTWRKTIAWWLISIKLNFSFY